MRCQPIAPVEARELAQQQHRSGENQNVVQAPMAGRHRQEKVARDEQAVDVQQASLQQEVVSAVQTADFH